MNVYKMNDCDWVAAHSKEEAMKYYAQWLGNASVEEAISDGMFDPEAIAECSLDEEMWSDWEDPNKYKTTFRAVIAERAEHGDHSPFFIASTEY